MKLARSEKAEVVEAAGVEAIAAGTAVVVDAEAADEVATVVVAATAVAIAGATAKIAHFPFVRKLLVRNSGGLD